MSFQRSCVLAAELLAAVGCGTSNDDPCEGATAGSVCRWAGTGHKGLNVETPRAHRLDSLVYFPSDLTFAPDGRAYVVDWNNHLIRRVEHDGTMTPVLGADYEGDGAPAEEDRLPECNPQGAHGTIVAMNHPTDVKIGPDGLVYVAAWHNNKIRVLDPDTLNAWVLTGDSYGFAGDGALACSAVFNQPKTLVFAPDDSIYTIDQRNGRIRKISPGTVSERVVTTIAGTGALGARGDGGPALEAEFGFELTATPRPSGALLLRDDQLYVADSLNHSIRRIDLTTGMIDCWAGCTGAAGYAGDGGDARVAQFDFPLDLEQGPDGRMYVADRYNHAIRAIDMTTGVIETVVGDGVACDSERELCPEVGAARELRLHEPYGIAFDPDGNLYVADTHNSRIMKVLAP